jgi:hypothetical protein
MVDQHAADTLQPFLDQLREALTAVANGDPEPMKALCSHTDAISQCGFWGGVESGWAEVGERWEWVASQFVPGQGEVTSETAFLTVSGEMAYGVFIERFTQPSRRWEYSEVRSIRDPAKPQSYRARNVRWFRANCYHSDTTGSAGLGVALGCLR